MKDYDKLARAVGCPRCLAAETRRKEAHAARDS
jgi:hypothetical protein